MAEAAGFEREPGRARGNRKEAWAGPFSRSRRPTAKASIMYLRDGVSANVDGIPTVRCLTWPWEAAGFHAVGSAGNLRTRIFRKTTLTLHTSPSAEEGGAAAFVDAEHALIRRGPSGWA